MVADWSANGLANWTILSDLKSRSSIGPLRGVRLCPRRHRRATLLGLNPPIGHAVAVIQHPPQEQQGSTDGIHALLDRIASAPKADESEDSETPRPN